MSNRTETRALGADPENSRRPHLRIHGERRIRDRSRRFQGDPPRQGLTPPASGSPVLWIETINPLPPATPNVEEFLNPQPRGSTGKLLTRWRLVNGCGIRIQNQTKT